MIHVWAQPSAGLQSCVNRLRLTETRQLHVFRFLLTDDSLLTGFIFEA